MKPRILCLLTTLALLCTMLVGCSSNTGTVTGSDGSNTAEGEKISVIVTNFAEYDFVRQITGGLADITSLLSPGSESHTFEPSAQQMVAIGKCDLFVYVGGESDVWVDKLLGSLDSKVKAFPIMECVTALDEETVSGMEAEPDEETGAAGEAETEYDEHVWTSPKNAITITEKLSEALCAADPKNADAYTSNTDAYLYKLKELDKSFTDMVNAAARKTFVVADRFPFRYLANDYGLTYSAAYKGCSSDTSDPSPATIQFMIDKIKSEGIPVVFYIELSNRKMADTVAESTGAKEMLLSSCHNVTAAEFADGVTYIELMNANLEALREALN